MILESSLSRSHLTLYPAACLPHYTSGQTYYYPAFNAARAEDALKFAHEFGEVLAMPIMLEAVMRVRASRGLYFYLFHGLIAYRNKRSTYVVFPRKLLRPIHRPSRNAGSTSRSVLRH